MWTPAVIPVLALLLSCATSSTSFEASSPAPPQFPLQFEADLEITGETMPRPELPQELVYKNPTSFDIPGGYTHDTCTRSVVGFPYIHIFDHYARF
ncbi:hypothetical protein DYB38_005343 [Aphanomyces astaci]|uniref:Uncharacterized protein n=1 Tax=Aphanomyces astaci TaxID=112090 RepID=A0A397C3U1_APHAT|nr:hypothetical protein DYB38_005343 [Aphanomyces astaci]